MLWGEKTRSRRAQKADLVIVTAGTRVPQAFLVPRRDFYFSGSAEEPPKTFGEAFLSYIKFSELGV